MILFLIGLISAFAFGFFMAFMKLSSSQTHPIIGVIVFQIVALSLSFVLLFILKINSNFSVHLSFKGIIFLIITGLCVGLAQISFFMMLSLGNRLSIGAAFVDTSAILIAVLLGIFILGEQVNLTKIFGLIFAILGIFLISLGGLR